MSGGTIGRQGYGFQDLLLLLQVLDALLKRRSAEIAGGSAPDPVFHIEAPPDDRSPDWDLLSEESSVRVLEEVKGGDIKREDRLALWRRTRCTVASLDARQREPVVLRLSVDRSNPPNLAEHWPKLAAASRQAMGTKSPGDTSRITSALALAEEALLHLTQHVKADGTLVQGGAAEPVLTLARAREVLASFDYNDRQSRDDVARRVDERIAALGLGMAPRDIYVAARGFIATRAEAPERQRHTFTANELIQNIHALDRLSRVDAADARLWRSLCALALEPPPEVWATAGGGLSYQDWRTVQPELPVLLDPPQKNHIALLGPGGRGKSTILWHLYERARGPGAQCLWLPGDGLAGLELHRLGPALSLGAWHHYHQSGGTLKVFIDALESAAIDPGRLREALSSLAASEAAQVTLSVRDTPWREAAASEKGPSHWLAISLRPWSRELVRGLVRESQRPEPSEDLLELLRTPLLLDLFLRTFHAHEPLPPGELQSRHGLIAKWWQRRILPDGDPKSTDRAAVLERCAEEEADGGPRNTGTEPALRELASEGLLVIERGRYRFRHPLLRDFALQQWAARTGGADAALARLERIQLSLVRDGALRALLEATVDRAEASGAGLSLKALFEPLCRTAHPHRLEGAAADFLGAFDDPRRLAASLTGALQGAPRAAAFMERVLHVASLVRNLGWVRELATLPDQQSWAEGSPLVDERFLPRASELFEAAWSALSDERQRSEAGHFVNLAERLRTWSEAPRLWKAYDASPGNWVKLMRVIVRHAPSLETLQWLQRRAEGTRGVRRRILALLPELVGALRQRGISMDPALQETYLRAADLEWRGPALLPRAGDWEDALPSTVSALLKQGASPSNTPGLLRTRPEVFLPLALGLLVGMARKGALQEASQEPARRPWGHFLLEMGAWLVGTARAGLLRLREWLRRRGASGEDEKDSLEKEMERRLGPPLTWAAAFGGLEDDVAPFLRRRDRQRRELLKELCVLFTSARDQGAEELERVWKSVCGSASAQGHLLLLQVLTESDPPVAPERVDQLLAHQGLYHCPGARQTLHGVLQKRWGVLNPEVRRDVLSCIESTARSPTVRASAAGYLLDALPPEARPEALRPCWEFFDRYGRSERQRALREEAEDALALELLEAPAPFRATSQETFERWLRARRWLPGLEEAPPARLAEALQDWQSAWNAGFPGPGDLESDPWPLDASRRMLEHLSVHRARDPAPWVGLGDGEARKLAAWALDVMRARPPGSPGRQTEPFEEEDGWEDPRREIWRPAAELLERILLLLELPAGDTLHEEFVTELRRQAGWESPGQGSSPRVPADVARYLFHVLHLEVWPPESSERRLLRELLNTVSEPMALWFSLQRLHVFSGEERLALVQRWLTTPGAIPQTEGVKRFVGEVGTAIGVWFLHDPDGPISAWAFTLLSSRPSTGLLAHEELYSHWASGIAYAFAQEADETPLDSRLAEPSARLLTAMWLVVRESPETPRDASDDPVLWMFAPVFDLLTPLRPDERERVSCWWRAMESLACQVVNEGSLRQVDSLIFELRSGQGPQLLGARPWEGLVDSLISRMDRELSTSATRMPTDFEYWPDVLEYVCEFFEHVAEASAVTEALRERLYSALSRWGEKSSRAVQAAQRVRMAHH